MVIAIFSELLLVPALVMSTRIITIWDLLYLKLGPEPHRQVPLFAGLRPLQARIVVLMAHLERCNAGTFLTRRGELREELYVLLRGRVEVRVDQGGPAIRTLGRGDVLGEMGLVRHQPRSADAVCVGETEYLVLDGDFLERLLRRYPRIAAKLFLNLTRILSDRLESATHSVGPQPPAAPALPPTARAVAGDEGIG
jgi:CRP-like cAMP-binding protein